MIEIAKLLSDLCGYVCGIGYFDAAYERVTMVRLCAYANSRLSRSIVGFNMFTLTTIATLARSYSDVCSSSYSPRIFKDISNRYLTPSWWQH